MNTDQRVHDREFGNLLEIKENSTKTVVSMDEMSGRKLISSFMCRTSCSRWNVKPGV